VDEFGMRQVELFHNPEGQMYCLLDGPDEDAIRKHHGTVAACAVAGRIRSSSAAWAAGLM
jgi:hypothetical protein